MRLIILSLSVLLVTFNAVAQKKPLPAEYGLNSQIIDGEKKAAGYLIQQGNRNNSTLASENFDINYYRCEWRIDPAVRFISGKVTSYFTILSPSDNITFDLSDTLTVDSVTYHGNTISFQRIDGDGLQLQFPVMINTGQEDSVSVYYNGVPRSNSGLGAFSADIHAGIPVIWTLSEPYGAKEWWPCKNGLTDKADSVDIIITSPVAYSGTANGVLIKQEINGADKTVYFKHRYPIATYLVAIAVTNYVTDIDSVLIGTTSLPVIMNSYPEYEGYFSDATAYAKECLLKFSQLFGEYPFSREQYSQTEFGFSGGMEHQTNSFIFNAWDQLVAHELAHHWFGDKVTCGSWQDIWLNEGFANYSQFLYVQNFDTSIIMAHLQYYLNVALSKPNGSVFVTDTTDVSRIFSSQLTYAKGGYVVHMLRGVLGDSVFFRGLRQYLNDPLLKNKFAVTADLKRNLEQVSGKDLESFFQKWIYGQGYPNYNFTWTQNTNNWAKVQLNQTTSDPSVSFYDMPIQLEFRNNAQDTIITVNNQQNGETVWVNIGFAADTMIIDPNYWILAKDRIVQKIPAQSTLLNEIKIYPNPAPDHLTIQLFNPTISEMNVQLYNVAGQLVYKTQKTISGADVLLTISMTQFARGSYVLVVSDNKKTRLTKVITR